MPATPLTSAERPSSLRTLIGVGECSEAHLDLVSNAAFEDGHGAALGYRIRTVFEPTGMSLGRFFEASLDRLGIPAAATDLFVDRGFIDQDDELEGLAVGATIEVSATKKDL